MKENLKSYLSYIDKIIETKDTKNIEEIANDHLIQIKFFQHERLIHLIVTVFVAFLRSPLIFVKIAIDAISSANNPVNAVIADANFAESISESTTIAPVRIAIALAILIKVPAFSCV